MAASGRRASRAPALAAATDNVHLELSSSFANLPTVRRAVAIAGPERLLWGSDAPLLDPGIRARDLPGRGAAPDALERVFWSNAAALYGL